MEIKTTRKKLSSLDLCNRSQGDMIELIKTIQEKDGF